MRAEVAIEKADVVVIGGGAAAVSVCQPMLAAGMKVLIIDAGTPDWRDIPQASSLMELRQDERRALPHLIDPQAYSADFDKTSPKLRTAHVRSLLQDFAANLQVETRNFVLNGMLTPGGMTTVWGAIASCFADNDFKGYPIGLEEMLPSYQAVAGRIGISGSADDDLGPCFGDRIPLLPPLRMQEGMKGLYDRYEARRLRIRDIGLRLGHSRQAVLTSDFGDRSQCSYSNLCLWGCGRDSIYSARQDLDRLKRHPGVAYMPSSLVRSIERQADGGSVLVVEERGGMNRRALSARKVVLAAGAVGSTVLAFTSLGRDRWEVPLLTNPAIGFALLQPSRLGAVPALLGYGMAQLAYSVNRPGVEETEALYGYLYSSDALPVSELIARLPVSRPNAIRIARRLWPAMVLGSGFFPSDDTRHRMVMEATEGQPRVSIDGAYSSRFPDVLAETKRRMSRAFRAMGAYLMPLSFSVVPPGADMHYAGTLPMKASPSEMETDVFGRLGGKEGVYAVDGSVLPRLPGKAHTLTIMANADRIGRHIAASR